MHDTAGHTASVFRKQKEVWAGAQLSVSFSDLQDPAYGTVLFTLRLALPQIS